MQAQQQLAAAMEVLCGLLPALQLFVLLTRM
jgi:hypothetical protein